MRIIRNCSALPKKYQGATVALGNFDGVHLGHQAILKRCVEEAAKNGSAPAVMTFEPHPREFFSKTHEKIRLYPLSKKIALLRGLGIEILYLLRFNQTLASRSATFFVEELLHRELQVKHVITGADFAFGKDRQGNTQFLADAAKRLGFGFSTCTPVKDKAQHLISSSAIRKLLADGDVKKAASLLGRPYSIEGRVRHGEKRGRGLGFPTANLSLATFTKPRFGVYAARLITGGKAIDAVANIGVKPTFGHAEPLLEVHAFDMHQELYGKRVAVELVDFIRDEKRFDGPDALKKQITSDCKKARTLLHARRT